MNYAYRQNLEKKKDGSQIIAKTDFPAGVVLFEFTGNFFTKGQLPKNKNDYIQIGKDLFMGPSGDFDDYIEHNCNPNAFLSIVGKRAILKSLIYIKLGMNINIDYSLTSTETKEEWMMECHCNPFRCRKEISGFQYLTKEQQDNYDKQNIVPKYVTDSLK